MKNIQIIKIKQKQKPKANIIVDNERLGVNTEEARKPSLINPIQHCTGYLS